VAVVVEMDWYQVILEAEELVDIELHFQVEQN
jgi:hypothetical protein